jgi:hypothetical protein
MLQISVGGYESPGLLRVLLASFKTYVEGATAEFIAQEERRLAAQAAGETAQADLFTASPAQAAAPAAEPAELPQAAAKDASEVVAAEKPGRKKRAPAAEEVKPESPDTATVDNSAVIAEAKAQIAAEQGEPAKEVDVAVIRAIAKLFNTDELRDVAKAILAKHDAPSVTALAERDNIIRVSVLADFEAAAAKHNLAS